MKAIHQAMMGVVVFGAMILALGVVHPTILPAWAQHGHEVGHGHAALAQEHGMQHGQHGMQHADMSDPDAHFQAMAEHLGLTAEQQEALAEPFTEAFAAMQRLHEVITTQLDDEQKATFNAMVHEMMGGALGASGQPR